MSDTGSPFDRNILTRYPYPIAAGYRRLLETSDPRIKTYAALRIFEYGLRAITLGLISQYLIRDKDHVSEPALNQLLLENLPHASLSMWQRMFFETLAAYKEKRQLLFMKELYDLYWATSEVPREGIRDPYTRLITLYNDLKEGTATFTDADWRVHSESATSELLTVLKQFSFLQHYALVYLSDIRGDEATLIPYVGEKIPVAEYSTRITTPLKPGLFYLSREDEEFLELHPLLIFWEGFPSYDAGLASVTDAAMYEAFSREQNRLLYYATVAEQRQEVGDPGLVREFVYIWEHTIRNVKQQIPAVGTLTWSLLQEITQRISKQNYGDLGNKYQRDVYLQRQAVKSSFEAFLASDKVAFLLLGKSGVGKSNFFLSIADDYANRGDVCVMLVDGTKIDVGKPIRQVISESISRYLRLESLPDISGETDLLDALESTQGIEHKRVILFIDAINENTESKKLLQRIDELVASAEYPWFKVAFSSRPEAWRVIKRGVKLTEHRYFESEGSEGLGVELLPFSFSAVVTAFSRDELYFAYQNYSRHFGLQTDYNEIPRGLLKLLNDPLTLRLVAETYGTRMGGDGFVPSDVKPTDIYRKYIEKLIESGRLTEKDIRLLEREIVPIMMGTYSNVVTSEQVNTLTASTGRPLFDLVRDDSLLSSGERINQSFTNLVDADILVLHGTPLDYEIGFQYERFYDYYAGTALLANSLPAEDRLAFFLAMLELTTDRPYLWGAISSALVHDVQDNGEQLVLRLCYSEGQRAHQMAVSVLTELGRSEPKVVDRILKTLIGSRIKSSAPRLLYQLITKSGSQLSRSTVGAQKIAIAVADDLVLPWVLKVATISPHPGIRAAGVRAAYRVWERDRRIGWEILRQISKNVIHGIVPDQAAIEATLGFSYEILFNHPEDSDELQPLQDIARDIFNRVLVLGDRKSRWRAMLRDALRELVFSGLIRIVFGWYQNAPSNVAVNLQDLEAFFRRHTSEKELCRRISRYIDPSGNYSRQEMERDFMAAVSIRDFMFSTLIATAMTAQIVQNSSSFLPLLERFFVEATKDAVPNPYVNDATFYATAALDRDPTLTDVFDFYRRAVEICREYHRTRTSIPGLHHSPDKYAGSYALFLSCDIDYYTRLLGTARVEPIESIIRNAVATRDMPFFRMALNTEFPIAAIDRRLPRATLEVLSLFFDPKDTDLAPLIERFLARLRAYYPDEVDDFLEEHNAPDAFRLQIRTDEPNESIAERLANKSWAFIRDNMIAQPGEPRDDLVALFAKAADCRNAREWLTYMMKDAINMIYGREILRK